MKNANLDQLAERAKAGERDALEGLVRGLQDMVYRLALRFLTHPEPARDETQEILILVITQLSSFRGESSVVTWAYRVAVRHLLRARQDARRARFEQLQAVLGQPPNSIEPAVLETAEARLLEEEIFLGCTQAMLRALDPPQRIAFVLGSLLELDAAEAAAVLEVPEATFRKRLSRARSALDDFMARHCGVASSSAACRCSNQVNYAIKQGRLNPAELRYATPNRQTSLEALRALGEIKHARRSLELYRAQPDFKAPEDFAAKVRSMIDQAVALSLS